MSASPEQLLNALRRLRDAGQAQASSTDLTRATGGSPATVRRQLQGLCARGDIVRTGRARATRYALSGSGYALTGAGTSQAPMLLPVDRVQHAPSASYPPPLSHALVARETPDERDAADPDGPAWSPAARRLRQALDIPLAARTPVTYRREVIDAYLPNTTWLMGQSRAEALYQDGRLQGQQPAGTYARKVLEQLLIDLSWSSSRLEGNRYTLLATEELFKRGAGGTDLDAVMLLNHKAAIEFMVDAVPLQGLTNPLVRNLHALLMQDLLPDSEALGTIRQKVVNISGTVYVPTQVPSLLEEMLEGTLEKARRIKNPIEAAFFLWVNLAYLQPFEDGNKRTSRLAANIPLMLYNCAPLSFLDVDGADYAQAMLGVYEFRDMSLAADLFDWAYRRSMKKYAVVKESLGLPDPMRARYREQLTDAVGLVVRDRQSVPSALGSLGITEESAPGFRGLLETELASLGIYNCARYRLTLAATEAWVAAGRPS